MKVFLIKVAFALFLGLCVISGNFAFAQNEVPYKMNYQGYFKEDNTPITGAGYFKFSIVDDPDIPTQTFWTNDGSIPSLPGGQPDAGVITGVNKGICNVVLGDISISNMTEIDPTVFTDGVDKYLRVWYSRDNKRYTRLSPDKEMVSGAYAYYAYQAYKMDGGVIDDTIIGGVTPAEGFFTNIDANNGNVANVGDISVATISAVGASFAIISDWTNAGMTIADLGLVTTVDIDGGTIDGMTIDTSDITVGAGKTLDVSAGTLTLADDQINGDKVEGGTIDSITISQLGGPMDVNDEVVTNVNIDSGAIDDTTIGAGTPSTGAFTTLSSNDVTSLDNAVTVNDTGADVDFRVEGSGQENALFVQGSDGKVGIGTATPGQLLSFGISETPLAFQGATDDEFETTFVITDPTADRTVTFKDESGTVIYISDVDAAYARRELDNLQNVAINTSLISDADDTDDLGSAGIEWKDLYIDGTANVDVLAADAGAITTLNGAMDANGQAMTNVNVDSGAIDGTTIATSDITVGAGKVLDVSAGTLTLANDQINGDKVEGGTIAAITISQLAGAMDANSQDMTNVDINSGTIDGTTIATSDVTVGAGKVLDVSAGTLTLADDQISGDKVEGGTIDSITISQLGGSMDVNDEVVTNVNIDSGAIDDTPIGVGTANTGAFTTLSSNGLTSLDNAVTVNDTGADVDFRVEGSGQENALFVQGSDGKVGIGTASPEQLLSLGISSTPLAFEGLTDDDFETTFEVTDPTDDRTITFQNRTGTVALVVDLSEGYTTRELDNLQSVAINTSLISDTDDTDDLGSAGIEWKDLYVDGTANVDVLAADTGTIAQLTGAMDANGQDMTNVDIDSGTIDGATIATSDVTVGAGKVLDVSAGTLTLADDQISGDKVEGGTIDSITISQLGGPMDVNDESVTNVNIDSGTIDGTTIATSDVTVGAGKVLDVSAGTLTLADDQISGNKIQGGTIGSVTITQLSGPMDVNDQGMTNVNINSGVIDGATIATSDVTVGFGKVLNVSGGTLTLADDQISGDKIQGGTIGSTTIALLGGAMDANGQDMTNVDINSGTIDGTTIATSDVTVGAAKVLDVSAGTLTLADDQISGNKVEGGTIASVTISQLGGAMDVNNEDMTNVDIDSGTIDGTTIATSDVTVGAGKVLDVSAGTLTLADDQISGDKVEGGTIASVTISQLGGAMDANNQTMTNVDIDSGAIDGTPIGATTASTGAFTIVNMLERTSDPSAPAEGQCIIWMSDGTGKGDDGDVMIASTAGGVTRYTTLFNHNTGTIW